MDVPAAPRPHSNTQRPTQAYYVPRKLLECGRGPQSKPTNTEKNEKPIQTSVQKQKPRPLMDNVITTPTSSIKEKSTQSNRQKSNAPATKKSSSNSSNSPRKSPPAMTAYQPPLQYPSLPRDLHLVSSTPSSRSSSSMSSSGIGPQISPTLTVSSPRVLHVKGGPQKYSLPRPNAFAPMIAQSDEKECICDRKKTHVVCKRCGYECVGRVQVTCGQHPMILALNDLRECPNPVCHSVQLLEFDEFGNEDVHDDTIEQLLAEPIEKIDLQS
ncbi:hypothetical protein CRE_04676 [Caenorhabditis remanei]|uniref:Uncharacterized protein n=1 Tax=Caenorhabditis remanei TaxID=31234 RepID=E3LYN0_CAERE|nr:hypothetical protein CRE_04676 [Caenorhabditis remanei]